MFRVGCLTPRGLAGLLLGLVVPASGEFWGEDRQIHVGSGRTTDSSTPVRVVGIP